MFIPQLYSVAHFDKQCLILKQIGTNYWIYHEIFKVRYHDTYCDTLSMYNVLRYASAITPLLKPSLNENEKLLQCCIHRCIWSYQAQGYRNWGLYTLYRQHKAFANLWSSATFDHHYASRGLPMWFPRPTVNVVPFPSRVESVFMVTYGHE